MNYLIVGAGAAGVEAALEIRKRDESGIITILDSANEAKGSGYIYRPALKEYVAGKITEDQLVVLPESILREQHITIIHGQARSLDRSAKRIRYSLHGDEKHSHELSYDKLLIATGAKPTIPKFIEQLGYKENVFTFRTLRDGRRIKSWIENHRGPCLVVGGGILGMETAEIMRTEGIEVSMITSMGKRLFTGIPQGLVDLAIELFGKKGIRSILSSDVREMLSEAKQCTGFLLNDGERNAFDTVIVCTGVTPETTLAKDAGLEASPGIYVDGRMQTRDEHIYAAGDCAHLPWSDVLTTRIWEPCRRMGRTAGANMAGEDQTYDPYPGYYHTHLFGIPLGFFGTFDPHNQEHRRIVRKTENSYREIVLKDNRIIGASFMGGRPFPPPFLEMIRAGKIPDGDPKELLMDTFDLESLWYL